MKGENLSWFSISDGVTFLPPAVMMMSFMRSVMVRNPSCVEEADVTGVEPPVGDRLRRLLGILEIAEEHVGPLQEDLALRARFGPRCRDAPRPTVPSLIRPAGMAVARPQFSVWP